MLPYYIHLFSSSNLMTHLFAAFSYSSIISIQYFISNSVFMLARLSLSYFCIYFSYSGWAVGILELSENRFEKSLERWLCEQCWSINLLAANDWLLDDKIVSIFIIGFILCISLFLFLRLIGGVSSYLLFSLLPHLWQGFDSHKSYILSMSSTSKIPVAIIWSFS